MMAIEGWEENRNEGEEEKEKEGEEEDEEEKGEEEEGDEEEDGKEEGEAMSAPTRCFGWGKNDKLDESGVRMGLLSHSLAVLQGLRCKGWQRTQVCRDGVGVGLLWVPV